MHGATGPEPFHGFLGYPFGIGQVLEYVGREHQIEGTVGQRVAKKIESPKLYVRKVTESRIVFQKASGGDCPPPDGRTRTG